MRKSRTVPKAQTIPAPPRVSTPRRLAEFPLYPPETAAMPPLQPDGNRLVSKKEALAYLGGTSWPAVWKWIRDGKFPSPRQLGGRVFWLESELYDYISSLPIIVYAPPSRVA